ncbi:PREDICTED: oligoribonuclease, mitochondrial-like isoform X2 [Priapulus caudatus]|uniref:Oligoribonuclease, mitochondrial-like isoform X2 n=1 Tax=Priapulus caudatus TaxID=37621 RepID=A0ABM1EM02_PRICU|nr:PREDICTED: oligoribonuclease, mitochondrial-like isoform X2 [Priapulus caudatus]
MTGKVRNHIYNANGMAMSIPLPDSDRIVWMDLEMTGLNVDIDHILEIACLITDDQLNIVVEGPNLILHQPESVMNEMNDWCKEHHGQSGLTEAVIKSDISLQMAEVSMLSFLRQHVPQGKCPLGGNSIHVDKKFLDKYMPQLMHHLHYRIIDVSSIKELCRRWYPSVYSRVSAKKGAHRAMDDIRESIHELKLYRSSIFCEPENGLGYVL